MTFYYYNEIDGEKIKNKVNINAEKLNEIYQMFFEKLSNKREIKFVSDEIISFKNNNNVIIENYNIKKIDNEYEISYTMYDNPQICQIINGLLDQKTFPKYYNQLLELLYSTRREKIEAIRRKIDMEIRKIDIMLDNPNYDYKKTFIDINLYNTAINRLCYFDRDLAKQAEIVNEYILVEKISVDKMYIKKDLKLNKRIS